MKQEPPDFGLFVTLFLGLLMWVCLFLIAKYFL
jgi:hypothetical protein